ncbi:MAG: hypothetical protein KAI02_01920 [Gammaproteobacteria bacterium]|nr:hypothetical protein [Gammaproteobacteria bacterium]
MSKTKFILSNDFDWCPDKPITMQTYKLLVNDLSPTQFATGKAEILYKSDRFSKKFKSDPNKLYDYLLLHPIPVVKRGKKFYLVDHHHLVRGLYEALNDQIGENLAVYVQVMFDGTSLEQTRFWNAMFDRNFVYLFDANGGGPKTPEKLPDHISKVGFDAYRSLAWLVRDHHGYLKNNKPFSEFKWANYFRTRLLPKKQGILSGKCDFHDFLFSVSKKGKIILTDEGEEVLNEALFLAMGPEAAGLPGYLGR